MVGLDLMAGPPAPLARVALRDRTRCLRQFEKGFIRRSEAVDPRRRSRGLGANSGVRTGSIGTQLKSCTAGCQRRPVHRP
jgi:hypothetical protein